MELQSNEIMRKTIIDAYHYLNPEHPVQDKYEINIESMTCKVLPPPLTLKYSKNNKKVTFEVSSEKFCEPWLILAFDENFFLKREHINSIFVSFETDIELTEESSKLDDHLTLELGGKEIFKTKSITQNEIKVVRLVNAFNMKLVTENEGIANYIKNGKLVRVISNCMFQSLVLKFIVNEILPLKNIELAVYTENLEPIQIKEVYLKFNII